MKKRVLSSPICQKMWNTVNIDNQQVLAVFCGKGGSGKSWASLTFAVIQNPNGFRVKKHVVSTAKSFVDLLNVLAKKKARGVDVSGTVIIFDEAGTGIYRRNWYTEQSKLVMQTLQIMRFLNLIVIFTVPALSYIDKDSHKLLNYFFEPWGRNNIIRSEGVSRWKCMEMNYDSRQDKIYYVRPRIRVPGSRRFDVINGVVIPKPPTKIRNAYEKSHMKFKTWFLKEVNAKLRRGDRDKIDTNEIIEQMLLSKDYLLPTAELMSKYDLSINIARACKTAAKRRIKLSPLKDGVLPGV